MTSDGTIRLFHLPFSFMLPQKVASERGYFEAEGIDVELIERDREAVDTKYIPAETTLTGDHDVDLYPICKWESLKRTWDMDDGRIVAKGTFADLPYAVVTRPDTDIETPADLAGRPVAINRRTGQEYTAMRALEEHIEPGNVTLAHHGMPTDRLRAVQDGEVDAATLLDPHITLAEHLGLQTVLEFENHMGIVGSDRIDDGVFASFMAAYGRAVEEINANPDVYREEYLDMLAKDLEVAPGLFDEVDMSAVFADVGVPEYEVPEPAEGNDLDAHLNWMKARDLIGDEADIRTLIAPL